MNLAPIDQVWLLACSALVLLMQGGFLCLEAGLTRSKNAVNVALKNLVDLAITPLLFWGFGASLMFGTTWGGLFGVPGSLSLGSGGAILSFLVFQTLFCASAATIVSGAIAERMRFAAYVTVCLLLSGLVYPLVGHWAWGGAWTGEPGWLQALGFIDFAGSGVVHMTGGFAALAGALAVGPRLGRFDADRINTGFPKSSLPLAMLGTLMLAVGWVGFNGGSTPRFDESIGVIVLNTVLAGSAGGAATLVLARASGRVFAPEIVINGLLGGLVAVCALADVAAPVEAIVVGVVAGAASFGAGLLLVRLRIDDAVGAFPVHGVCGVVGLLAQPLMSSASWSGSLTDALLIQTAGALAIGLTAFLPTYVVLRFAMTERMRRVTAEEERVGLNLSEHGVESELHVLLRAISVGETLPAQANTDDSDDATALARAVERRVEVAFHEGEAATLAKAQRAQAEELRDYGRFLHAVLDGIETQVCILDESSRIVETNRAWDRFAEAAGAVSEGAVGASFVRFCRDGAVYGAAGPAELGDAPAMIAAGDAADFTGEYPALVAGEERLYEVRMKPLPSHDRGAVIVLQTDRTEERNAGRRLLDEKQKAETLAGALEASQASLELAMRGGELGLWHWDVSSGYFELSHDWIDRLDLGETPLDADIDSFRKLVHSDELVFWTPEDAASLAPEEPYDRQFRLRRPDGCYQWVQVLGKANSVDAQGVPESLSGILIDIDARKATELRDAGMAKIIEESLNEVYVVDRETDRFIEVNRGARENLGYSMSELLEMSPTDLKVDMTPSDRQEILRALLDGTQDRVEIETLNRRKDGSTYPVMLTLQCGRLMDRDVLVGIGVDLTQRHQLEQQLAEAQKLESIGQLAAGVAHEMNTPLQFVGNNIKFLSDCSASLFEVIDAFEESIDLNAAPKPWRERYSAIQETIDRTRFDRIRSEAPRAIEESLEGVDRVLQIVRAMKEFSHPGEQTKAPTDLNRALTSTVTVTRNRWKYAAELNLDLDPNLPHVECEGGSINQVFVNLIVNAADAIAERRDAESDAPDGRIEIRSRQDGDYAVFEFQDNGCGMPEEVQRRIFDPFFTTKEVGKGTGQGLSLSHTIVTKNHGGSISVRSAPGEGTVLSVVLPRTMEATPPNEVDAHPVVGAISQFSFGTPHSDSGPEHGEPTGPRYPY